MISPAAPFADTPYTPPDSIFELTLAFNRDPSPLKINLGQGAYRDEHARPWILPAVSAAKARMQADDQGHEYLPILGLPAFRTGARDVIFGSGSALVREGRVATMQTISGTGAVHVAAVFLKQFLDPSAIVYVSDPSWSNHRVMFEYAGFEVRDYAYYHAPTRSVDFDGFRSALLSADRGSIFILHACAHNPTGCDLTQDQWRVVGSIMRERGLVPLLDSAYQGFASGDLEKDAFAIRYLLEDLGLPGIVCQSFSKSMGLYGERAGALHVTVADTSSVKGIESQLGWISRKELSTCARYGATIAAIILNDPALLRIWKDDLVAMSGRIAHMRQEVVRRLTEMGTPGTWTHVTDQIGMFSYTGIPYEAVIRLRDRHIYMADNGRISVSGLNEGNVDYFCQQVHEVLSQGL